MAAIDLLGITGDKVSIAVDTDERALLFESEPKYGSQVPLTKYDRGDGYRYYSVTVGNAAGFHNTQNERGKDKCLPLNLEVTEEGVVGRL